MILFQESYLFVSEGWLTCNNLKRETSDKQQSHESKQHGTKDARKAEQQITNAETKQKEKMKKQNIKE